VRTHVYMYVHIHKYCTYIQLVQVLAASMAHSCALRVKRSSLESWRAYCWQQLCVGPSKRQEYEEEPQVMQCVALCCNVLQCVAMCCNVLQCAAMCCKVLQCVAMCCSVLQCVAMSCNVLQCVAMCTMCCSVLQCVAVCYSVLQHKS